jgi:UDP-N-acetylmuramoyl-L-alanyl-D-glutamate--2,6-diaminopimelate ligase
VEFAELLQGIRSGAIKVEGIYQDSRRMRPGGVFVCIQGPNVDGHDFAAQVLAAGAAWIVGERDLSYANYLRVDDSRAALADLAYAFYGEPARTIQQIGITGTNGKSTTCHLLASLLNAQRVPAATIGTLGVFFPEDRQLERTVNTTPNALEMARLLRRLQDEGARVAAVEVSSIALDQDRALGMDFAGVIFTNLTQDHLDYHHTFENYFQAKRRLFTLPHRVGIINIDDPYGARLAEEFPASLTISTLQSARIQAREITFNQSGFRFLLDIDGRTAWLNTPLAGMHNVYNLLSALGGLISLGEDPFAYLDNVARLSLPKGRWEVIGTEPTVIIDYAHTPDSMEQVLSHARRIARGRVITVFGCTGNRDRGKRPLMGEIASRYSEFVVLSNDNPEDEDPEAIAREALRGIYKPHLLQLDREKAIEAAINMAEADDLVLVLGKGHEDTIQIGKTSIPFSDAAVARRYWERRQQRAELG